jgi:hypothetical protein
MRRLLLSSALLLLSSALFCVAIAQNGATTTVTANPATVAVGGSVSLTATIQPDNGPVSPGHMLPSRLPQPRWRILQLCWNLSD